MGQATIERADVPKSKDTGTKRLEWLRQLNAKAAEIHSQRREATEAIRTGFVPRAVVFIDVVDSSKFKVENKAQPELWILRVKQFSELIAAAVRSSGGAVVKYIGDEVMGIFENVFDAQDLVARIPELEETLKKAIGFETRVKVSVDYGEVYLLEFEGHEEPDPQGTPIDRCARIGKFGAAGTILGSQAFVAKTPTLNWMKVGAVELKGIGRQAIYQLGEVSVDIEPKKEIKVEEYDRLTDEGNDLKAQVVRLGAIVDDLQQQLREAGEIPVHETTADGRDAAWEKVSARLDELRALIAKAPGDHRWLARFLFLHLSNNGGDTYNDYEGRVFDTLRETNIVQNEGGSLYLLNPGHKLVAAILQSAAHAQRALDEFLERYDADEGDYFEWSLTDPQFWSSHLDYSVLE